MLCRILQIFEQPLRIFWCNFDIVFSVHITIFSCQCQISFNFQMQQPQFWSGFKDPNTTNCTTSFFTTKHNWLHFQCHIKCSKHLSLFVWIIAFARNRCSRNICICILFTCDTL